MLKELACPWV